MTGSFLNVEDVLENYKSAVYEKDVDQFLSTYDPEIHLYDCWGNWECKGISKWGESVANWFKDLKEEKVIEKVDFNDVVVEENSDLAFVHCAVTYAAYQEGSDEKLRQMKNRFTFCLRKVEGSWRITHEHSSLPINMKTGEGIFDF